MSDDYYFEDDDPNLIECINWLNEYSDIPATNDWKKGKSLLRSSAAPEPTPEAFPLKPANNFPQPSPYFTNSSPEPIGQEPFAPIIPSVKTIKENDEYEESTEQWFIKKPTPVYGCTNPSATNYNPAATVDDGSCIYPVYGCTDPSATNYNPAATVNDGSCVYAPTAPTYYQPAHQIPTTFVFSSDPYLSQELMTTYITNTIPNNGLPWWLSDSDWDAAMWDGNPIDADSMTNTELCEWLKPTPSPYLVRGIRELYISVNPFADETAVTSNEIDAWNVEVILHIRRMLGYGDRPLVIDPRLMLEARWAEERKWTAYWDTAKYPSNTPGSAYGFCNDGNGNTMDIAGGHCGATFFPDATDRASYISDSPYNNDFSKYPELENYTSRISQSEAVRDQKMTLGWSIQMSVIMAGFICGEGTTGHAGPFLGRERLGYAWTVFPDNNNIYRGRFKWN